MNKKVYDIVSSYQPYDEKEANDKRVMLHFIETNEDVLTRENETAHFTVSCWVTNKEHNKILMIYHNIYDSWAWVGGHADGDDDFLHVALKELEEETGVTNVKVLSDGLFGLNIVTVDNHIKRGKQVASHLHFDVEYLLEADEEEAIRMKEDENSGVKWIPIDEVVDASSEEKMKPIYKRLIEKMKEC